MVAPRPSPYLQGVPEATRRLRVLVVEDAVSVRERLVPLLSEIGALDVVWAAETVREARDVLRTLTPDIALLDLRLPDGSGLEVLRDIRATGRDVLVVVLTAFDSPHAKQRCLEAGADLFVSKATGLEDLPNILRAYAEGALAR
jgi:two-component system, NarL family, response regulator DevR